MQAAVLPHRCLHPLLPTPTLHRGGSEEAAHHYVWFNLPVPTQVTVTGTTATATEGDMTLNIMQERFVNGQTEKAQGFLET